MTPESVKAVRRLKELRGVIAGWRQAGESIALVPTMGALHEGHLALVKLARRKARCTVVSIFVNPLQFAPHEDFSRYPREEAADRAKLAEIGCDLVWAPEATSMYGEGFATRVEPGGAALGLEGDFRPHFFAGVATVCLKLFHQTMPDFAVFGEKDYQQLCVIRQLVRDLDLPLKIVSVPTVRDADGLALSSRNVYLSPRERAVAPALFRTLEDVVARVGSGESSIDATLTGRRMLERAGFTKVDYIEVRHAETLAPYVPGEPGRVLAAAWLGKTRLIDNVPLGPT